MPIPNEHMLDHCVLGADDQSSRPYIMTKEEVEALLANGREDNNDPVNHPAHYTSGTIECIDFIDSCGYGLDFCLANAIKYLTRCKLKGTCEQDIRKAIWYATHAAEGIRKGVYTFSEREAADL